MTSSNQAATPGSEMTCDHRDHLTLIARVSWEAPVQWIWCRRCGVLITGKGEVLVPVMAGCEA